MNEIVFVCVFFNQYSLRDFKDIIPFTVVIPTVKI